MTQNLIIAKKLKKWFPVSTNFLDSLLIGREEFVKAVDSIDFSIKEGEIFGLVGESGSGKTTTGRLLLFLTELTDGSIYFQNNEVDIEDKKNIKNFRRFAQMIFQDPYDSLNPNKTIKDIIMEPLNIHNIGNKEEKLEKVIKTLKDVNLVPYQDFIDRYPHELSGGQRQRVAIARAIVISPKLIIADEPVSMLDVSIRADILKILLDLRNTYGVTMVYITHDLAIAKFICDRLAIMYLGKIVEMGPSKKVIDNPKHPYTKALVQAVPIPSTEEKRTDIDIVGEIPSAINLPSGCRFHTRCLYYLENKKNICIEKEPNLENYGERYVACHFSNGE
jgi:peptide/nickel transport system ATP-binding protein